MRKRFLLGVAIVSAPLWLLLGCGRLEEPIQSIPGGGKSPVEVNLEETRLATIPQGVEFKAGAAGWHQPTTDAVFDPYGRSVAYPARRGDAAFIMFGNQKGPDFNRVFAPVFSDDGKAWAYWAGEQNECVIVTNGAILERGKGHKALGLPVISSDGKQVAFKIPRGRKSHILVGDRRLGENFESIESDPVLSPDGRRIAYAARNSRGMMVVVDDKPLPGRYEDIRDIVFSADGKRIAFATARAKPLSIERVVCDGVAGPEYRQVGRPIFSPDSRKLAYSAVDTGVWTVVVDGKQSGKYDRGGGLVFSPNGSEVSFWAMKTFDVPAKIIKGDWESSGLARVVFGPVYSPDGSKVAYVASERLGPSKEFVGLMDEKGPAFDEVWVPRFSPDQKQLLFGAKVDQELWWKSWTPKP